MRKGTKAGSSKLFKGLWSSFTIGLCLTVLNKYDEGDNSWIGMNNIEGEWYIVYHGSKIDFAGEILEKGFAAWPRQALKSNDHINELI